MFDVLALFFLAASPEQRAVDYLAREVRQWPHENHCFSCHNNGDAARALYTALHHGYRVPPGALHQTDGWLQQPAKWEAAGANPGFHDTRLARVQFSAALAESGLSRDALIAAADALVNIQEPGGEWRIDTGGAPGAPATYGAILATYMARRTLESAGGHTEAVARANRWLAAQKPSSTPDRAVLVLAGRRAELPALLDAQTSDGGWGPQPRTPAEPFDTAIVLLALQSAGQAAAVARGRAYLLAHQLPSGGWQETTRPAGLTSYAEHISTTAWVLYALVRTAHP